MEYGAKPRFQYKIDDHLGDQMVFFEDRDHDGIIKTESDTSFPDSIEVFNRYLYYPFGLNFEGIWNFGDDEIGLESDYQYNEKELDKEAGTGWSFYGFRMYDSKIGRFTGVDPIADEFVWVNTYNYAENSPIANIDLWGLQAITVHGTASDNTTFTHHPDALERLRILSGNSTINNDFNWPEGTNGLSNDEDDRLVAAQALAAHVLNVYEESPEETITLIGHSHGGNVAIQAIDIIRAELNDRECEDDCSANPTINLITIATPAYIGENDRENPLNTTVENHIHFFSSNDAIQTTGANTFGGKDAVRQYNGTTNNIEVVDYETKTSWLRGTYRDYFKGSIDSHSPQYYHPEVLRRN